MALQAPYTMIASGATASGKTYFVSKLLQHHEELHSTKPFDKIIYYYSMFQDAYKELLTTVPNIELKQGIPDEDILSVVAEGRVPIVFDDLMMVMENDKRLPILFTKCRHADCSIILILQNLYHDSKYLRTVTRNAHYLVLFKKPWDAQMISRLGNQIFQANQNFYLQHLSKQPHNPTATY